MLLVSFVVQSTSQLWIMGAFFANRDYIARVLCINKDVPESGCNGACYLKKQLHKDREKQEKQSPDLKLKEVILFYETPQLPVVATMIFDPVAEKIKFAVYRDYVSRAYMPPVFHPPALMVV